MSKIRVELNGAGIQEMLKSAEMKAICEEYAGNAVSKLGAGYEASTYIGATRVNASVKAVSHKAKRENMENNTILKAVGGK